ncbi:MAG: energy-coupling factor ABC transporter permease [bacterium]
MHMADALISPAVGGALWVVSGGLIVFCARKVKQIVRDNLVPLMGMLGAFIFAAQMINFSIPGTGSSGHLGGGLILTLLLGPYAAFLVIASVLTVQAFFFADGGLLALGCNIFNLGFFPAFVAYPLIYQTIAGNQYGAMRTQVAALVAAVVGLQLGALSVVLETLASGISELPFSTFVVMMLPIHLAIGIVEGLATIAVIAVVARARPEALFSASASHVSGRLRPVLVGLAIAAVVMGGMASWFASKQPDGLEWSIAHITGGKELSQPKTGLHKDLADLQEKTVLLPEPSVPVDLSAPQEDAWPNVSKRTSVSGLVGGSLTLVLASLFGIVLRLSSRRNKTGFRN